MIIVGIDLAKRIHSASIVHQSSEVREGMPSPFTTRAKGLKSSFSMLNVITQKMRKSCLGCRQPVTIGWPCIPDSSLKAIPFKSLTLFNRIVCVVSTSGKLKTTRLILLLLPKSSDLDGFLRHLWLNLTCLLYVNSVDTGYL